MSSKRLWKDRIFAMLLALVVTATCIPPIPMEVHADSPNLRLITDEDNTFSEYTAFDIPGLYGYNSAISLDEHEITKTIFNKDGSGYITFSGLPQTSSSGHGYARCNSDGSISWHLDYVDGYQSERISFTCDSMRLPQYNALFWDSDYTSASPYSGYQDFVYYQGSFGQTAHPLSKPSSGFMPDDADKYMEDFGNPERRLTDTTHTFGSTCFNSGIGRADDVTIRSIVGKQGGVILTIDYDNGTAKQKRFRKQLYAANGTNRFDWDSRYIGYGGLPTKSGYTFAGWEVTGTSVYDYGNSELRCSNKFNLDGTHLLIDVSGISGFYRYYINLKAKWVPNGNSTLVVDKNDGSVPSSYSGKYLSSMQLPSPERKNSHTLTFNSNPVGSDTIVDCPSTGTTTASFKEWTASSPVPGYINVSTTPFTYVFLGTGGTSSTITATYTEDAYKLPAPRSRSGYSFVGWYSTKVPYFGSLQSADAYKSSLVGGAGSYVTFTSDQTLYAGWMKLKMNYTHTGVNSSTHNEQGIFDWGTGANASNIIYRMYRTTDSSALSNPNSPRWSLVLPIGTSETSCTYETPVTSPGEYTLNFKGPNYTPATGEYTFKLQGANGSGGNGRSGGKGGYVSEVLYLTRGQTLTGYVAAVGESSTSGHGRGGSGDGNGGAGLGYVHFCSCGEDWDGKNGYHDTCDSYWFNKYNSNGSSAGGYTAHWGGCGHDWNDWWGPGSSCRAYVAHLCSDDGTPWGIGCGHYIYAYNDGHRAYHSGTNLPAGSGGGATSLYLNGNLIMAAGGGNGANSSSNGGNGGSAITSDLSTWNAIKTGVTANDYGLGGSGGGRGYNFLHSSPAASKQVSSAGNGGAAYAYVSWKDYYQPGTSMSVETPDEANPDVVTQSTIKVTGINQSAPSLYSFKFTRPADNGTTWYYKVSMDLNNSSGTLQDSVVSSVYSLSGIKGYYYTTDGSSNTTVTDSMSWVARTSDSTTDTITNATIQSGRQWLHIAAMDYAGNLGPTQHYNVPLGYTVVFNPNNPAGESTRQGMRVQGTMANQYIPRDLAMNLNKNKFTRYGYTFQGWATSPTGGVVYVDQQSVINIAPSGGTINLYAVWKPNEHWVYYDKNFANATYGGSHATPEKYKFDTLIHTPVTAPSEHYISRYGWTFKGWYWIDGNPEGAKNSTTVFSPNTFYLLKDNDITIYAITNRSLKLILAPDYVEKYPSVRQSMNYNRTIWNHVNIFKFDSSDVKTGTTRTTGKYVATFAKNGSSTITNEGGVVADDGRTIATALNTSNNTITATRYFSGWTDKEQESAVGILHSVKLPDYTGTIIGMSGTHVNATVSDTSSDWTKYVTQGDKGTATITSSNHTITIYPQYTRAYIKLPGATRKSEPDSDKEDLFLGWFTEPQPTDGKSGDGGEYYGTTGDVVRLDGNVTLYPWFNIPPTIVHSGINKEFYEGQPVNYSQLMTLVTAKDKDNPEPVGPQGLVEYNGYRAWIQLYNLQAMAFLTGDMGLSNDTATDILSRVNYETFKPELIGATYYCDGRDAHGDAYSDGVVRTDDKATLQANGLNTSKERVGKLELTYQITDNGTYDGLVKILKENGYRVDSPITVQCVLDSVIHFNNLPTIDTENVSLYNVDDVLTKDNIARFILDKQKTNDIEDYDNGHTPWWSTVTNPNVANDNTIQDLYNTLKIVDVYDITFSAGYENDYPTKCETAKSIHSLSKLWALKEEDPETFKHITSYKIEFDCMDQWGKTASGLVYDENEVWDPNHLELSKYPGDAGYNAPTDANDQVKYGMSKIERSIIIIPFNNGDDLDLVLSNAVVTQGLRYIDGDWSATLTTNSYWGNDTNGGADLLSHTFDKYVDRPDKSDASYSTTVRNGNSSDSKEIDITINDYTNQ